MAWTLAGHIHLWGSGEREPRVLPPLKDHIYFQLSAAPQQLRLASLAFAGDSFYLDVMLLPEGQPTQWAVFTAAAAAQVWWVADGSLMIWLQKTENGGVLYRVRGPGRVEQVGTIPRALADVSLSRDGRRVVLVTRDFRGDVWLAHLKRPDRN